MSIFPVNNINIIKILHVYVQRNVIFIKQLLRLFSNVLVFYQNTYSEGEVQENDEIDEEDQVYSHWAKRKVVEEQKFVHIFKEKQVKKLKDIKEIKDEHKSQKKYRNRKFKAAQLVQISLNSKEF